VFGYRKGYGDALAAMRRLAEADYSTRLAGCAMT
jgi:hypothetical protein